MDHPQPYEHIPVGTQWNHRHGSFGFRLLSLAQLCIESDFALTLPLLRYRHAALHYRRRTGANPVSKLKSS
jgi:hypothetical protein